MNNETIKKQTFSGVIWKFMERICSQGVSFIVTIILARILMPDDYSVVSIVTIFFAFCNVFISGGFGTALIQKKNSDVLDYSTILFFSLVMSGVLYVVMFFAAPYIARTYDKDILVSVIRVMSLIFFVNSIKSVLSAYVSSNMKFRIFFVSTVIGTVVSAIVGIVMAINGFGPWALITQQMVHAIIDTIVLFICTKMKFIFTFSWMRFKILFRYSWKLFATSLIAVTYNELKPLVVGIKFSPTDLAYYTKGHSFPSLANSTISSTIMSVIFPVFSKMQDNKQFLLATLRRYIKVSSFLIFPLLLGLASVSETLVKILLTEKWLSIVPYMQIFCVCYMFDLINTGNLQAIQAIGRTDISLITEIIKKSVYFIIIITFIYFADNAFAFAISNVCCVLFAVIVNTFPNRKLLNYKYRYQIADISKNIISSAVMFVVVYLMKDINLNGYILFFLQILSGIFVYIVINFVIRNENLFYFYNILKTYLRKIRTDV